MTTSPGTYNFTIYKGCTFSRVFAFKNPDGSVMTLTGYGAEFTAKPSVTHADNSLHKTDADGITIDGAAGTVTLTFSATETEAIDDDQLMYSLKLTSGAIVTCYLVGVISISDEAL